MILTDIAIEHVYKGRKVSEPVTFTVHPFAEPEGEHAGLFEVMLSLRGSGEDKVRSLADGVYPDTYPGKKVPRSCVAPGSDFERLIKSVDRARPVSAGLRAQIALWDAPPEEESEA